MADNQMAVLATMKGEFNGKETNRQRTREYLDALLAMGAIPTGETIGHRDIMTLDMATIEFGVAPDGTGILTY